MHHRLDRRPKTEDRRPERSDHSHGSATYGSHPPGRRAPTRAVRLLLTVLASVLSLTPAASRQLTAIRVSGGHDLQAALDRATPGDVILLQPGAEFVGNFVLRSKGEATAFVTVRTDSPKLPPPGTRIGPEQSGTLAALRSPNQSPALRTAPGANHWRIENVEFKANAGGKGDIIVLGSGGADQPQLEGVPHALVLDRVYVHGDARLGQKRGLALNSADTQGLNSYFSDIKVVGPCTQAIAGWNGPGPFVIENNYIEAAAENLLFGGSDPAIEGLVPTDITIRHNHLMKPVAWRDPLVATPGNVRSSVKTGGGTVAAGDYSYQVVAERPTAGDAALSAATVPTNVTLRDASAVALEWDSVADATGYRVYRHSAAGDTMWKVAEPRFTDSGAAGAAGTPPKRASVWGVKNILELKNAKDVVIDGNVLENNWVQSQSGAAILFTPRNQGGKAPWTRLENIRFTNNIVRNSAAAIALSGQDDLRPSQQTRGVTIRNNLFAGIDGDAWGGNGDWLRISHGPADVVIEQNTVEHTGRIMAINGNKRISGAVRDLVFRGNVVRNNKYGILGAGAAPGQATIEQYLPGLVFAGNIIAGGKRDAYPKYNLFVDAAAFLELFQQPDAGNYRLKDGELRGVGADFAALTAAIGSAADQKPIIEHAH